MLNWVPSPNHYARIAVFLQRDKCKLDGSEFALFLQTFDIRVMLSCRVSIVGAILYKASGLIA